MTLTTPSTATGSTAANVEVDTVTAAIERLTGLVPDAGEWPTADRRALLGRLDRAVDALGAVRAAVLLAERDSGAWHGAGFRSFEAWRAHTSRGGERTAAAQTRQAEHLAAVPAVTAAVTAGQVTLDHAATIGRVAATGTPAQQAAVTSPAGQEQLLALARGQDAGTFATTVARWAATVDPDGLERDHQAQRRARFLHLADTPRGTVIKGQVDTMAGNRLRLALEALSPRPGAEDDRDPGQRRADALDTMATRILSDPGTTPGAHVPPHVSLILTEATWHAARAERDRRRRGLGAGAAASGGPAGAGAGADARADAGAGADARADAGADAVEAGAPAVYDPATLEDGTPVPPSELAQVMCDCDITRVVIDADGAPLDLGRTRRLFSGPQRRAVIARDRECIWPGCHAPARWCEIHHTRWWERDGGPTSVEVGALICSFHHHETHRRDLSITRVTDAGGCRAGARPPATTLARVHYEFRDPTGRIVGPAPPSSGPGPVRPSPGEPWAAQRPSGGGSGPGRGEPVHPLAPERRSVEVRAESGREPPDGPRNKPPEGPPGELPDALDLGWATDPVTGVRIPAFLLGPVQ